MEIIKKVCVRMGQDYRSGDPFIKELFNLNTEFCCLISEKLGLDICKLHDLTCNIKKMSGGSEQVRSITGDHYLSKKVLKIKFRIILDECELIDDKEEKNAQKC